MPAEKCLDCPSKPEGRKTRCADCWILNRRKLWREYAARSAILIKKIRKKYSARNSKQLSAYSTKWRKENRARYNEYQKQYQRKLRSES